VAGRWAAVAVSGSKTFHSALNAQRDTDTKRRGSEMDETELGILLETFIVAFIFLAIFLFGFELGRLNERPPEKPTDCNYHNGVLFCRLNQSD
jgi:hypothetical protein